MLTAMTEEDWTIVLRVFAASRSRRGDKGRNDRKFLEALHYFVVHNITWRALPEKFGHWNSVWKRFWRLSRSGTFEAFFDALAAMSETAHLVQMFDSTVVRVSMSRACSQRASQNPSRPASKATVIRLMVRPAWPASFRQRCRRFRSPSWSAVSFFRGWRSIPGTMPATSQLDWLISITAIILKLQLAANTSSQIFLGGRYSVRNTLGRLFAFPTALNPAS